CVQSVSRSFTAIDAHDPLVADTLQLCSLMPINLNPVATNGAIYNWSPATGFDPSTPSPVVTPTQSITYTVTISDPASLCSVIKTIRLNVANGAPELPDITNTCNANVILAAANSNAQYTYEWSTNPNFNSVFAVTPLISITPSPGQTAYYLRVRTPEGCLYIDSTLVNSNGAAIHVNGQNPSAVCSGDNFIWSVTNEDSTDFNTYLWSPAELITGGNGTIGINVNTIPVGTHTFTVVATNQYGCTAVDTATLSILNNPEMSFIPGNINCDGLTVCFQNTSTNAGLYLWDFDDNGNTSTAFQPCYTFSDTGHYFVSLTVGTPVACNDTFMTEVYLPGPINNASFTWTQLDCTDSTATIAFQNTSVLQNQIQSIHWIFETVEGISTSPIMNPTLQINSAQLITATMVINLDNGCVDTARNIINASLIDLTYPVDVVYACDNQPTALNPNGNPNWQYLWSPANAVDNPTSFNPIGNPAVASQFTVSVYDPSTGCSAEDTVQLLPIQNVNLDFTAQQECDSYQVNFTNNSQNAPFYNWYFGDPNNPASSTAVNPSFTYSDTGTYTVVLTLNIGAVCNATLQVPVHVEEPISADFTYTAQDCSEIANISFDNNSTGGTNPQYTWNINGTNTNIENPSYNT
ncbi:MAG: PKD domain-containing protein, partial [Saprospiraceae bacterium]